MLGSSSKSNSGRCNNPLTNSTRRLSPPDSLSILMSSWSLTLKAPDNSSSLDLASRWPIPYNAA